MKAVVSRALRLPAQPFARYAVLLAVLLAVPSAFGGFAADDYIQLALYRGHLPRPSDASLFGLFSFLTGNPRETEHLVDIGYLPWWSAPGLRVTFFRPFAELSHALDYRLWPDSPALMHLHSVLWFALLVYLAARLYARVTGSAPLRNLAVYIFAVSALHATTVGWLANRNALVAGVFGLSCLIFHDVWRRDGKALGLPLSMLALAAALFSAEAAIGTCAYLLAYALFIDTGSRVQRALRLVPLVSVFLAWKLYYDGLGFGAYASGLYLDPSKEPLAYLYGLVERAPVLLLAQLSGLPTSLYIFMERPQQLAMCLAAVGLVLGFFALFWGQLWREQESRFFLVGMLLSLLPVGAAGTDERSLLFVSLGGVGVVALIVRRYLLPDAGTPRETSAVSHVRRGFARALIATHVVLAPVMFLVNVNGLSTFTRPFTDQALKLPVDDDVEHEKLIFINSPAPQLNMHLAAIRLLNGLRLPHASYSLAPGNTQLQLTRSGNRLIIEAHAGFVINYDALFRGQSHPFAVGDVVQLKYMRAEVQRITADGRPEVVAFTFADGLDDPQLKFLAWQDGGYQALRLPPDGGSVALGRQDPLKIVLTSLNSRARAAHGSWERTHE